MRVISGAAKGRKLKSLRVDSLRPTSDRVKEALFNMIAPFINNDALIGDFFAGTGNIGIEFLSRGVKEVIFVEKDERCVKLIKENLKNINFSNNARVFKSDVIRYIRSKICPKFDIIFLDPPYKSQLAKLALEEIIKNDIIKPEGLVIAETTKNFVYNDGRFQIYREKKYGDTKITIFIYGGK